MLYIKVATDWIAYLAFTLTALSSAAYLRKGTAAMTWDRIAGASAEVGLLFTALRVFAGALWSRLASGEFWTWDTWDTTTAFLMVTQIRYLAVRGLGGSHQQRARRAAVIALLAIVELPLLHFSVRLWRGLHHRVSGDTAPITLRSLTVISFIAGLIAFTLLYVWLVVHRQRVLALRDAIDDRGLDCALAQRIEEAVNEPARSLRPGM